MPYKNGIFTADAPPPKYYYGNISDFLRNGPNSDMPDLPIITDGVSGEALSYNQIFDLTDRLAYHFNTRYNLQDGDVGCIFTNFHLVTPLCHYALLNLGAVVSPANVAYTPAELLYQLKASGARFLVTRDAFLPTVRKALAMDPEIASIVKVATVDELWEELKAVKKSKRPIYLSPTEAKKKLAYLCFSSGTSGVPKGVMTSHHNLTSNVQQLLASIPVTFSHTAIHCAVLPLTHIFGLQNYLHTSVYRGSPTVYLPSFDLKLFLDTVVKYKVTNASLVPPILIMLQKSPVVEPYLPEMRKTLRAIASGAAPLGATTAEAVRERLGCTVLQGYGLTESSPVTHFCDVDDPDYTDIGSIGKVLAGVEVRLVDDDGKDVPLGSPGEVWLRGPNIMMGYYRNPKATAETLTKDGWLKTGDVGVANEKGLFYIVDRKKELIKSYGHQVAPAELEAKLLEHEDVVDCAVIGISVPEEGTEYPRAFVQLKPGTDPLAVKKWFDGSVSKHKQLWGGIAVLDVIPKSPSGKILRRHLRDMKNYQVYGTKASGPRM